MQEVSVRTAKGISAAASIAGSVLVFTPFAPVGIGLLAAGGGVGLTATGGDMLGQRWQQQELIKGMSELEAAEVTACKPDLEPCNTLIRQCRNPHDSSATLLLPPSSGLRPGVADGACGRIPRRRAAGGVGGGRHATNLAPGP